MMFSTEQIDYLDKHFDDRYNAKFVQMDYCTNQQKNMASKFANDDKRIDLILQNQANYDKKMALNNKLTIAVLCGIVTLVFTLIGMLVSS